MNDKLANYFNRLTDKTGKLDFEERAFGMIFILAVVMLGWSTKENKKTKTVFDWDQLYKYAKSLAPKCFVLVEKLNQRHMEVDVNSVIISTIEYIKATNNIGIFTLSDFYLLVKEEHRKSSSNKSNEKISGTDLLHKTQFFTEPYMAEALLLSSFKLIEDKGIKKEDIVIIDPAVGAANILLSAFDLLTAGIVNTDKNKTQQAAQVLNNLVGYDLDPMMKEIASLSLAVAFAIKTGHLSPVKPKILGGESHNSTGFLDSNNCSELERFIPEGSRLLITNPPFLGKRMMDAELREFIKTKFPSCRGDMCASFIMRCGEMLREGDVLALVHQNTFFHLSSLEEARKKLQSIAPLATSVTLGVGAFSALSGEKTNVSLSVFDKSVAANNTPILTSVADFPYKSKQEIIQTASLIQNIKNLRSHEISSHIKNYTDNYKSTAHPMQGSSTGNNDEMIRYLWEKPSSESDWVLASKGGGYSRWWGLNRFLVYWGKNGERIKEQSGSALRNIDKQKTTQLVYSDTGSSGLNVRIKRQDQVFMASGPGIIVLEGDAYAHLAFLNSRLATYFLRKINPKLTVSAGYLGKLPFNKEIAKNKRLASLGSTCVELKKDWLSSRLMSADTDISTFLLESTEDFDTYFSNMLNNDVTLELQKLKAEGLIENEIMKSFGIGKSLREEVWQNVSFPSHFIQNQHIEISVQSLDTGFSRYFAPNLGYKNGVKLPGGISADGPLEAFALTTSINPEKLAEFLLRDPASLSTTKLLYLEDKIHKVILHILGFNHVRDWTASEMKLNDIFGNLHKLFPDAESSLKSSESPYNNLKDWTTNRLSAIHNQSFWGCPILHLKEKHIGLHRQ